MRIRIASTVAVMGGLQPSGRGFTLTQMLVAVSIFLLVVAGSIVSHVYGLKMFDATQSKLDANTSSGRAIDQLSTDIRSAYNLQIGTGSLNTFSQAADNSLQSGNAIQLYTSSSTNTFIRYYWDSAATNLNRVTNGSSSANIVAKSISSGSIFSLEDYAGNVLLHNQNGGVIGINLSYYGLQYAGAPAVHGGTNITYQVKTKVNRRGQE